ncbi:MAG: ABC transporter ATP-binding protein, partial [Pseudaminobacter sp.]
MTALLQVERLSASYGKLVAVREASLTLVRGQIVAIIGPNGAGKSTLLNAIVGAMRSTGEVRFDGRSVAEYDVEDRVGMGLCLVPETRELFGDMTVADNLLLGGFTRRRDRAGLRRSFEMVYGLFPRLAERQGQLAATLSGGERQMLALGRALMLDPKVLMLDEPSLGLAPLVVREILSSVAELRDLGSSILLVEQNARAALKIADYGYVLEGGSIQLEGTGDELRENETVS